MALTEQLEWVTDRSPIDANLAAHLNFIKYDNFTDEQKALYENGLKGAYTVTDMNRVDGNVDVIAERILELQLWIEPIITRTWEKGDKIFLPMQEAYLNNIKHIRDALRFSDDVPDNFEGFDFQTANYIESLLDKYSRFSQALRVTPRWTGVGLTGASTINVTGVV